MWNAAELCKFSLGDIESVATFDHSTYNFGNRLCFIDILSDFRIGLPDMLFVIGP